MLEDICNHLKSFGLQGMVETLILQEENSTIHQVSFIDRLKELIEAEELRRTKNRSERLIKRSGILGSNLSIDEFFEAEDRGVTKLEIMELTRFDWKRKQRNIVISGSTGTGKTWLAKHIGIEACKRCVKTTFKRSVEVLEEMRLALADGTHLKKIRSFSENKLFIIDDFGSVGMPIDKKGYLLELVNCLRENGSIIITSQLPIAQWYGYLGDDDAILTEAILDRLFGGAVKIQLNGDTLRARY